MGFAAALTIPSQNSLHISFSSANNTSCLE